MAPTGETYFDRWMKGRAFALRGDAVTGASGAAARILTRYRGGHLPSKFAEMPIEDLYAAWPALIASWMYEEGGVDWESCRQVHQAVAVVNTRLHRASLEAVLGKPIPVPRKGGRPRREGDPNQMEMFE
ncbi:MAG: hypothetical protein RIB60_07570 [Phycisphaerales bacterium]